MALGKLYELKCVIKSFKDTIHVIVLSETWIKTDDEAKRVQIPGYTHYYNFRRTGIEGGVSIFVHNHIEDMCDDDNHYLWVHISKFFLNIGAFYKPERTNVSNLLDTYSLQLQKMKRAVGFGDFNFNLLEPDNNTRKYKSMYKECNFNIMNKLNEKYCTRETAKTKTILDHVCSNLKSCNFHFAIVNSTMSDHKHIYSYFEVKMFQPPPLKRVQYTKTDYTKLYDSYSKLINCQSQNSYEEVEKRLLNCLSHSKIVKTKILNSPRQDWINKDIIKNLDKRNRLWQYHIKDKSNKTSKEHFKN